MSRVLWQSTLLACAHRPLVWDHGCTLDLQPQQSGGQLSAAASVPLGASNAWSCEWNLIPSLIGRSSSPWGLSCFIHATSSFMDIYSSHYLMGKLFPPLHSLHSSRDNLVASLQDIPDFQPEPKCPLEGVTGHDCQMGQFNRGGP